MKSYTSRRNSLLGFLLTVAVLIGCSSGGEGVSTTPARQQDSLGLNQPFPADTHLIEGTLDNGLKYYIRQNQKPEQRAELRLVVNAGSVLETTKQQGLAHFTEHMAFNGTKHFEKQELVNYLESIGMQFGPEVNAYTSFDETVYMLRLPTDSSQIVETGMQILKDWSHNLSFDSTEVEKERGVIREEWRLGRGANTRMRDEQFPILFKGSRYADRLPIGQIAIIDTFRQATLRKFYHEWYRPDLMAVVAVGDFDPQWIQSLIRKNFSDLRNPKDAPQRTVYPVPDNQQTLYAIASDPEATRSSVSVYYKQDVTKETTVRDYREMLVENLYNQMLNQRLNELTQQPDPPFLFGYSAKGNLIRTKDAYILSAGVKDNGIERGLEALLTEAARVDQYGFTPTELDRAKKAMLRGMEQAYTERNKTESGRYAAEYIRNFLSDEPIPGIEYEYKIYQKYVPTISLEEVNRLAGEWISDTNRVILANLPEKPGVEKPTRDDLAAVMQSVDQKQIQPYADTMTGDQLVEQPPQPGKVVSESRIDTLGVTEWKLANGVRVILKPTDFKNDEIRFTAFSPGGLSLVPDSNLAAGQVATGIVTNAGVGRFTRVQLRKLLSDKVVSVQPQISDLEEGFGGSASPKDVETLFQLIYLYMTAPRVDSTAYLSYRSQMEGWLQNRSARPETAFSDTLQEVLYDHHPWVQPWTMERLNEMDMRKSFRIYKQRFADAGDFTFIFVGNLAPEQLKPLVETYLGGLPNPPGTEHWEDPGLRYAKGVIDKTVRAGMEPKSRVQLVFTGPFVWTHRNRLVINAMVDVMRIKLREVLREDLGGTYGVGIGASTSERPVRDYRVTINFGCDPGRVDELTRAVFTQIDSLKQFGSTPEYLEKVKEMDHRSYETNLRENRFWVGNLEFYYDHGQDPREILAYPRIIDGITLTDIQLAARKYFNEDNYIRVVLRPEDTGS